MIAAGIARLAALQHPDGGFGSWVASRDGLRADRNGFTTAIVLRTLRHVPEGGALAPIRRRALDFLEGCAAPGVPGGYAFWPERLRPPWAAAVPADVDDTAIFVGELLRHGRLARNEAMRSVCAVILPCRTPPCDEAARPPWIPSGCFHTWVGAAGAASPRVIVDCCVNANVAALLARLDAKHLPGYGECVRAIEGGLAWAAGDAARLDSLTPFYPSPHALHEALGHAVECGAHELGAARDRLGPLLPATPAEGECRSAYGRVTWRCPAIAAARAVAAGTS